MNMADLASSLFWSGFKNCSLNTDKAPNNYARQKMLMKTTGMEGRKKRKNILLFGLTFIYLN